VRTASIIKAINKAREKSAGNAGIGIIHHPDVGGSKLI
jgi:hypothetical protein